MSLHRLNRERLCRELREKGVQEGGVVLLQGGDDFPRYCSDVNVAPFRQVGWQINVICKMLWVCLVF